MVRHAVQAPSEIEMLQPPVGIPSRDLPLGQAYFRVSERKGEVTVVVDTAKPSISLAWDWRANTDFIRRTQTSIAREFEATFTAPLQFRDNPCGWFGP
jgi:hypothetical protein